ncbi:uncharacterized protein N7473_004260 [Penicillium subrubescens]|uniref:uncharacterized protein n=1 Tax=Penicillium subrubescens TaxID=1316194 RepID=UPI0025458DC6|nr:uncharacterized protein N7473_004260 [Penicillium subrubescens]KAJ5900190.1 hypothetical protein N7473_004260 [Penicillium subrubescens]
MMFSAAFTIGTTLTVATYYAMRDKRVLAHLQAEIAEVWPSTRQECPSWSVLEKLPYLSAVIKETFRMTGGVLSDIPRITPLDGMTIGGCYLPQGTTVSSSNYFPNHDRETFDNPDSFYPERWTRGDKKMQKWELAFSVGPRQCPAISHTMAPLYICLAHIIRLFELDYPDKGHLQYKDYFVPLISGPHLQARIRTRL